MSFTAPADRNRNTMDATNPFITTFFRRNAVDATCAKLPTALCRFALSAFETTSIPPERADEAASLVVPVSTARIRADAPLDAGEVAMLFY